MSEKLGELKDTIAGKFNELTGQKSTQEQAQDKANGAVDSVKKTGSQLKESAKNAGQATQEKFSEAKDSVSKKAEGVKEELQK
eukprot:jgi/Galph1/2136/GphlegSOOS_G816.1